MREKLEDIVLKLLQVEVLLGQGRIQEAMRQISATVQTYYRWRNGYGVIRYP